ncbi:MAG: glycosyltransferase family 9 protein [Endomicrobium sp.]|jgi:heptosyltransferase-2|nr:glycosyltransferase family 9 protein [Endomicrobium sp.]
MIIIKNTDSFEVFTDCSKFKLDRPCVYQKYNNVTCKKCKNYSKLSANSANKNNKRILIVKLGAMGDVLRTTFILNGLKEIYSKSEISWIVDIKNAAVLKGNNLIDRVIHNNYDNVIKYLANEFFDIVINLDLAFESLSLTKLSNKKKVLGFTLDDRRNIITSNNYAKEWLKASAYDKLKKANTFTYQYWMSKITELPKDNYEIIVPLQKKSIEKAEKFLKDNNINNNKKIIGINPGAGNMWKLKKWTPKGFIETAKYFSQKGYFVLLLGSTHDKNEIDLILKENMSNVISTGINNTIPDFFAKINLCNVVLCGDTMALHAAAGLKKNIVALFGPTSINEIEIYSKGVKIQSNKNCVVCYKQECNLADTCMEAITAKDVIKAVKQYL